MPPNQPGQQPQPEVPRYKFLVVHGNHLARHFLIKQLRDVYRQGCVLTTIEVDNERDLIKGLPEYGREGLTAIIAPNHLEFTNGRLSEEAAQRPPDYAHTGGRVGLPWRLHRIIRAAEGGSTLPIIFVERPVEACPNVQQILRDPQVHCLDGIVVALTDRLGKLTTRH